jgi:Ran GTPase-activating protein (RanGAP) involved in mRNA processing and transport
LTHLNLNDNSIGDEGAKALAQVLPSMTGLTKLDLKSNQIGDAGADALANVLSKMNKLSYIDLSFNNIGDEGAKSFANGVKNMDNTRTVKFHLNLDNNYIHNKESISQLNTVFAAKTNLDFVLTINSQEDVNKSLMRPRRG